MQLLVQPGAKKSEIAGPTGDGFLKIRVHAAAVEGRANKALIEFLSHLLDVRKAEIQIISGENARKKRVAIKAPHSRVILDRLSCQG